MRAVLVVLVAGLGHDGLRGPPLLNAPPKEASPLEGKAPWETERPAKPAEPRVRPTPVASPVSPPAAPAVVPHEKVPRSPGHDGGDRDPISDLEAHLPVSDAVRAVAVLCVAYFSVHFLLAIGAGLDCYGRDVHECMEDLRAVVSEAPMLGVLFLALRLQSTRTHGVDPPGFVRIAMEVASVCLLFRIVATIVHYADEPEASRAAQVLLAVVGFGSIIVAVVGTVVTHGLTIPASIATAALALTYVTFGAALEASRFREAARDDRTKVLVTSQHTLSPAPMLALGFLAVELQRDANYAPTEAATVAIYISCAALLSATMLVLMVQLAEGSQAEQGAIAMENKFAAMLVKVSIPSCMGVMFVAYGVLMQQVLVGPLGPQGVSAALTCILVLTVLFFGVYAALFVRALTAETANEAWTAGLLAARRGVAPAPMVGVLIVAARMRALSLNEEGGPPGWCMDGMYVATLGVFLTLASASAKAAIKPSTGSEVTNSRHFVTAVAGILLFGGVLTILGAIFTMRHETATGTGSVIHRIFFPTHRMGPP